MQERRLTLWRIGSGVATSLPLLWFAAAARRLFLSTIGILQYLAPSIAFVLGGSVYTETFDHPPNLIPFGCIWAGVFRSTWESLRKN